MWEIAVVRAAESQSTAAKEIILQQENMTPIMEKLSSALSFRYGHIEATKIPSKLTATQLKGRDLDNEVAEGTGETALSVFRKPGPDAKATGKAYGNATHTALQYISFERCSGFDDICSELDRMTRERLISPEQAQMVDCEKLAAFFATPMGEKLRASRQILREFKFSILVDAAKYYPGAKDEKILFQGVVDCALIEDDGIIVLDFKTDYVTEETLERIVQQYRSQVTSYAQALSRIYGMPVKAAKLYFFGLGCFVDVL